MPAQILPNIAQIEKHLMGYKKLLRSQHYQHFKNITLGIISGENSIAGISRYSGVPERTLQYFFNESVFNEDELLKHSLKAMDQYTTVRSTNEAVLILDFTPSPKTGKKFEWADWLWNEKSDKADIYGYECLAALEYHPKKQYRKVLGMRRFYHQDILKEDLCCLPEDFEKKPIITSRLASKVRPLTKAKEVIVDAEFINAFLINHFKRLKLNWTGRIKKSILATHRGKTKQLGLLVKDLIKKKDKDIVWQKASYRNQKIKAFAITVKIPKFNNGKIIIAVCKNKAKKLAFIATNILDRKAEDIVRVYGYRWEVEVFFKELKGNTPFSKYRVRRVGANYRWQIFSLIVANILELLRKTKLKRLCLSKRWYVYTPGVIN